MNPHAGPVAIVTKLFFTVLYGVPLLWIVLTSFKDSADVFDPSSALLFEPTVQAYTRNVNSNLIDALGQSVAIAVGATVLVLLISVPAAYALARVTHWSVTIGLIALIVLQMMPQTAMVIPLFRLFGNWGLLDSLVGVIIADAALLTPFATLLLRPFFRAVPMSLEESGALDGAGLFRIFWLIVLPLARNGVLTISSITFLLAWGEFLYAVSFMLSPGGYPLSALLSQQVSAFGIDWPGLMALAVLTSIPILIVFISSYRLLRDGLTVGAVK
ncbi:carbohydrate ABC transporter permease [Nesterenkonia sp. HG001]|uniref:carbohydrate ABC transporter permease n=1 Tax=Nesterenkonia sp. HG001 TaxID=2983207 RepID=UPI002AC5E82B|nr:carbohydrate ABC transporter permease [Nesterenkonia sp. HG001]MDZ5077015.1 carbohydrate ABC transporter permease [Nesterenkonia sp. HG001]